jgi:integrase
MAEIFKPSYTATDSKTGRKVKRKSPRWWIRYYTPDGVRHKAKGYKDRKATEALAAELVKRGERLDGGLADALDADAQKPLLEHLADYVRYLTAKGNTAKHVSMTEARVKAALAGCRFVKIADVQPSAVVVFLAELRAKDMSIKTAKDMSIKTANYYLVALKGFTRWLWRNRRSAVDALAGMAKLAHAEAEPRHARRDLTADELEWLLGTVRASARSFRGLAGTDRFHLYLTAAGTGLRVAELGTLTPDSFDLDAAPPFVRVDAGYTKNRKQAEQPLPLDVADALRSYLDGKPVDSLVWPGTWTAKAAAMLRKDLTEARGNWLQSCKDARQRDEMAQSDFLVYRDGAGLVADFHSFRHCYISRIVASGASAKVAQVLARHCDVRLTLGRYAHAALHDVAAAVDSLAGLVPVNGPREALAATGTDGRESKTFPVEKLGPFLGPQRGISRDKAGQSGTENAASDSGLSPQKAPEKPRFSRVSGAFEEVKAVGLEPTTYGLKVRCSTD